MRKGVFFCLYIDERLESDCSKYLSFPSVLLSAYVNLNLSGLLKIKRHPFVSFTVLPPLPPPPLSFS